MDKNFVTVDRLPPVKESGFRNPESRKFLLVASEMREIFPVESGILGFGIWNTALGNRIPLTIGIQFH